MARRGSAGRRGGMSRFAAGIVAITVIAVFTYFGFTKANPFADPFTFDAVFENVDDVKPGAFVRIAGVDVGKVKKVEPLDGAAQGGRVTFEVKDNALPIHVDATLKVRPRIFLEGNKFVDLRPGSPNAPVLEEEGVIPIQQTSASVSFGDVLTALQSDTRRDLQVFLKEYSKGLEGKGARGFNESIRYWASAYRNASLANDATLGQEPTRDVQRVLKGQQKTFAALVEDEGALKDLVTNLNITLAAFAREDDALQASLPELRGTLQAAGPALRSLNASFPSIRAFARDALPGVRSSGPTLRLSLPFITQARRLFRPSELRGAARELRAHLPSLVALNRTTIPVLREGRGLSACTTEVLVPFANAPIPDPIPDSSGTVDPDSTNQPFRLQSGRGLVGLSGESRQSDANNQFFNGSVIGPPQNTPPAGNTPQTGGGIRPLPPPGGGVTPVPHRPDVPCELQQPPNMNAPGGPVAVYSSRGGPSGPSPRSDFADQVRRAGIELVELEKVRQREQKDPGTEDDEKNVQKYLEERTRQLRGDR